MHVVHFDFAAPVSPAALRRAAHGVGCFYARHPAISAAFCQEALADARAFFALPDPEKQRLAIELSPHFRGYSVMRNHRDWREQIHFGREEPRQSTPLRGPNLWPPDPAWRSRMQTRLQRLEQAGRDILSALCRSLGLPAAQFLRPDEDPYLLLKLIHYQVPPGGVPRSGVAPHVDFSWITLLLQDATGGLEMRTPPGVWLPVPPVPGALVVNLGEILQFATRGYFQATPHRVVNRSRTRSRISLPFFLNPALSTTVAMAPLAAIPGGRVRSTPDDSSPPHHVHRVFPQPPPGPFLFGDAEWRRKGLGIFCEVCFRDPASRPASPTAPGRPHPYAD